MLETLYQHISIQSVATLTLIAPLGGAVLNGLFGLASAHAQTNRIRSAVSFVGTCAALIAFVAMLLITVTLAGIERAEPSFITGPLITWAMHKGLMVSAGLAFDQLSTIAALAVSAIGLASHLYAVAYMERDVSYARFFALMNLFLFFMLLLVLSDNLIAIIAGWEGIGLISYLMIAHWFQNEEGSRVATKAIIIDHVSLVALLIGTFLIFGVMGAAGTSPEAGIFNIGTIERHAAWFLPIAAYVCTAFFIAAAVRAAQLPFFVWLTDAMEGPTPASAFMHATCMVAASIYLIARLNFLFVLAPSVLHAMTILGALSALVAALIGVMQTDLKRILAFSTISQLGFMFVAAGVGAFSAAVFHLTTHTFFKVLLFFAAGAAIQAMHGQRDITQLGGLKDRMPITAWTFVIAAAALAGIPPTSGFASLNPILWQTFERGHYLIWCMCFVATGLTAFYIFRAAGLVFFGEPNAPLDDVRRAHEPKLTMVVPMMLVAAVTLFGGLASWPAMLGGSNYVMSWLSGAVAYETSRAPGVHTQGTELIITGITLLWVVHFAIIGWVIYAQKRDLPIRVAARFKRIHALIVRSFYLDAFYEWVVARPVMWFARRVLSQEIDATLIRGLIYDGTGRTVGLAAQLAQTLQTGQLQMYLIYSIIGTVIIIGAFVL